MSDFLKDIIKQTGNEYAPLYQMVLKVQTLITLSTLVRTSSMRYSVGLYMVDYHQTRLLRLLVRVQQVRRSLLWGWSNLS